MLWLPHTSAVIIIIDPFIQLCIEPKCSISFHFIYAMCVCVFFFSFCLGVEMVGRKKREMSGIVLNYFYSVGEAMVGLIFWLCRDWILLQLIVSVPPLLFIAYYWFIPESVRWLLARKDYTKAKKIVQKAAHVNGVELSEQMLHQFELNSPSAHHRHHDDYNDDDENMVRFKILVRFVIAYPLNEIHILRAFDVNVDGLCEWKSECDMCLLDFFCVSFFAISQSQLMHTFQ